MENELNKQLLDDLKEKLKNAVNIVEIEEMVKDNIIYVTHNNIKYKLTKPTSAQKRETYMKRAEKYVEYLSNSNFKPEEILRKLYKQQGIDIDALDKRLIILESERNSFQLKLGEALSNKADENELETYKKQIETIENEQREVSFKKTAYLEFSVENQINIFSYSYLTFLITQKEIEGQWIQAFTNFDEFLNAEEELINKITARAVFLVMPTELTI